VFNRFQSRRQKRRGHTEDPAAPFNASRRDAKASEMIDFALIDSTVNEWMHEVEHQQSLAAREAQPVAGSEPASTQPDNRTPSAFKTQIPTPSPTRPDPKEAMRRVYKALRNTSGSRSTPSLPQSRRASGKMDRVLGHAIRQQLLTEDELRHWMGVHGHDGWPGWRTVCEWAPERAHAIERLAATVYGFRPVLICQMSTLVLADLLTMRIPEHLWRPMMENGVIPVVEHGHAPDPSNRVLCVSNDPSNRRVRAVLDEILAFSPELAYADAHHIRAMMDLLSQHVPVIGACVYTPRPALKRIDAPVDTGKAA